MLNQKFKKKIYNIYFYKIQIYAIYKIHEKRQCGLTYSYKQTLDLNTLMIYSMLSKIFKNDLMVLSF